MTTAELFDLDSEFDLDIRLGERPATLAHPHIGPETNLGCSVGDDCGGGGDTGHLSCGEMSCDSRCSSFC